MTANKARHAGHCSCRYRWPLRLVLLASVILINVEYHANQVLLWPLDHHCARSNNTLNRYTTIFNAIDQKYIDLDVIQTNLLDATNEDSFTVAKASSMGIDFDDVAHCTEYPIIESGAGNGRRDGQSNFQMKKDITINMEGLETCRYGLKFEEVSPKLSVIGRFGLACQRQWIKVLFPESIALGAMLGVLFFSTLALFEGASKYIYYIVWAVANTAAISIACLGAIILRQRVITGETNNSDAVDLSGDSGSSGELDLLLANITVRVISYVSTILAISRLCTRQVSPCDSSRGSLRWRHPTDSICVLCSRYGQPRVVFSDLLMLISAVIIIGKAMCMPIMVHLFNHWAPLNLSLSVLSVLNWLIYMWLAFGVYDSSALISNTDAGDKFDDRFGIRSNKQPRRPNGAAGLSTRLAPRPTMNGTNHPLCDVIVSRSDPAADTAATARPLKQQLTTVRLANDSSSTSPSASGCYLDQLIDAKLSCDGGNNTNNDNNLIRPQLIDCAKRIVPASAAKIFLIGPAQCCQASDAPGALLGPVQVNRARDRKLALTSAKHCGDKCPLIDFESKSAPFLESSVADNNKYDLCADTGQDRWDPIVMNQLKFQHHSVYEPTTLDDDDAVGIEPDETAIAKATTCHKDDAAQLGREITATHSAAVGFRLKGKLWLLTFCLAFNYFLLQAIPNHRLMHIESIKSLIERKINYRLASHANGHRVDVERKHFRMGDGHDDGRGVPGEGSRHSARQSIRAGLNKGAGLAETPPSAAASKLAKLIVVAANNNNNKAPSSSDKYDDDDYGGGNEHRARRRAMDRPPPPPSAGDEEASDPNGRRLAEVNATSSQRQSDERFIRFNDNGPDNTISHNSISSDNGSQSSSRADHNRRRGADRGDSSFDYRSSNYAGEVLAKMHDSYNPIALLETTASVYDWPIELLVVLLLRLGVGRPAGAEAAPDRRYLAVERYGCKLLAAEWLVLALLDKRGDHRLEVSAAKGLAVLLAKFAAALMLYDYLGLALRLRHLSERIFGLVPGLLCATGAYAAASLAPVMHKADPVLVPALLIANNLAAYRLAAKLDRSFRKRLNPIMSNGSCSGADAGAGDVSRRTWMG